MTLKEQLCISVCFCNNCIMKTRSKSQVLQLEVGPALDPAIDIVYWFPAGCHCHCLPYITNILIVGTHA
jgi:hypothetical protein